ARLQVFPGTPTVVLDCAHNPASAQVLVDSLNESFAAGGRTLVFACSSDKDVSGMLAVLVHHFDRFIFTRYHLNPRTIPAQELAATVQSMTSRKAVSVMDDPVAAVAAGRKSDANLVVIAGSVYLAGEVLPSL